MRLAEANRGLRRQTDRGRHAETNSSATAGAGCRLPEPTPPYPAGRLMLGGPNAIASDCFVLTCVAKRYAHLRLADRSCVAIALVGFVTVGRAKQ